MNNRESKTKKSKNKIVKDCNHKSFVKFCKYCKKSFAQNSNLTSHINTVHLKNSKFKCQTCEKCFGASSWRPAEA